VRTLKPFVSVSRKLHEPIQYLLNYVRRIVKYVFGVVISTFNEVF